MSDTDENGMSQDRIEHLKLVELVHTRLVGNSSQMKTWTVSIVTAAFIFLGLSDDPHWIIPAGAGIAVIAFCIMDIRYLYLQRGFISLFRATADGANLGLWGNGDVQLEVDNARQVPYAMELVRQAFAAKQPDGAKGSEG